jgi:excisionase family DNA binding protein
MSIDLIEQVEATYYTYAQAAKKLGICKMTLWHWIKAGKLQTYRIGREVLLEKKAVEALKK